MDSSSARLSVRPIAAYRRYWLPELAVLLATAVCASVLFSVADLDISAARPFYHPGLADPWPVASEPLWFAFYRSTPWITASFAAAGAALLLAGWRAKSSRLRWQGAFVLLCLIVGPGLIINAGLKDHWGRPRPRDIVEFGGKMDYVPPLVPAGAHGKSFPCGHCSVGYLYAIGWWLWRRRRPRWAVLSLVCGLTVGTLLGFGRMAAGGHFLSDAVWSGLIALGTAHVLYYYVLRIPAREDSGAFAPAPEIERCSRLTPVKIGAVFAAAGAIAAGVMASWRYQDLAASLPLAKFARMPERVEVIADTLDVEILLADEPTSQVDCTGDIHGFGFPTDEINAGWSFEGDPVPTLVYRVAEKGWFLYIDGIARIRLPAGLRSVVVSTKHGNISVIDETRSKTGRRPEFDLRSADGWVKAP